MTLILNREEVISVINMNGCMNAVEKAFTEMANETAVLPLRIGITTPDGLSLYMPAYLKEMKALACKVVTVYKNNPSKHNLPTTIGKVLLQDPETGDVKCIMDGGYLTAVRTGAASGVATKYLARKDNAQVAGIFGAGVQAKMQLWAVKLACDIKYALVYDVLDESVDKFISELSGKLELDIRRAKSTDEILEQADIVCTATSSANPIFDGSKVKDGTHINGIGSHSPGARELDSVIIKRCKFIGDSKTACFSEAGDIMIPLKNGEIKEDHFYAELGEIITGRKKGRVNDKEITLFKSNGLAIQDVAAAKIVYDKALELGIGKFIDI